METVFGYVDHIIYHNDDNGYTVFVLAAPGEDITCVGEFPLISEGESLNLSGEYVMHPSYGMQLKVSEYSVQDPEDLFSIERYLGSGAIKGVGEFLASAIVERFGTETMRIVEEEPERLAEVKGISKKKAYSIADQVEGKKELRDAMIFLQKYGISINLSLKIYAAYGSRVYTIIRDNPYKMAEDISGVGFKIADDIAKKVGIYTDSDFRIRCGILYVLSLKMADGHTFLPMSMLCEETARLLEVDINAVEPLLSDLAMDKKVVIKQREGVDEPDVYEAAAYYTESGIANKLAELSIYEDIDDDTLEKEVKRVEKEAGIKLESKQAMALKEAAKRGFLILTGGPGTGKTTTINSIIKYFELHGMDIMLAAPTGRAAKRMSEMTGYPAKTIHRLLQVNGNPEGSGAVFEKNESDPLETDVVIVDETSMVDIFLMNALLKAIVPGTRLILVGDVDQLPSVGPGSVLKDIIDADAFMCISLDKIFRQAADSDIIVNAHRINHGESVVCDNKSSDFFFLKRDNADVIMNIVIQLVRDKLPGYVDATPFDIQVLCPTKKGLLGVERANRLLQEYLNPPSRDKAEKQISNERIFREGDKVMQTKNDYQAEWKIVSRFGIPVDEGKGIFNGDMGIITDIDTDSGEMTVEFDEKRQVVYEGIHKSQGSEYPAVVIPLLNGPRPLMNRNLLYTAVTRARKCVTLVGDKDTFDFMISNTSENERYTGLNYRLIEMKEIDE